MTVFSNNRNLDSKIFFDEGGAVSIARYDKQKYPFFDKLTEKQTGFFWQPTEIDCTKDTKDFKQLTSHEKHIFTSNLKRQILLDSIQGRAPSLAFLPVASLPEIETWIQTWSFFETIHSRSYTHILRNTYVDPSKVFDGMMDIKEIADCAKDISKYYDVLYEKASAWVHKSDEIKDMYELKKALWNALMAVNILEGIRFYVSFACSWNFAELKKMVGNASIIKLIARDENLHLAGTQHLLKILPKDDQDFEKIKEECKTENIQMFMDAIEQEKSWAKYLFKDGSMIGLNEHLLCDYIDWIAHKRIIGAGLESPFKVGSNPLPWTQKWIAGQDVQVAPQEIEITSYVGGQITQDINEDSFKGMSL